MKFLADETDSMNNEFFLLKKIFRELNDEKKNKITKLRLLIQKSREFYLYLKKIDAAVTSIKGYKYIVGKTMPVLADMNEGDFEKETLRNIDVFSDLESMKYNYIAWKNEYKNKLDKLKVYEVFFTAMMELLGEIESIADEILRHESIIAEKNTTIEDLKKEIKDLKPSFEEIMNTLKEEEKEEGYEADPDRTANKEYQDIVD